MHWLLKQKGTKLKTKVGAKLQAFQGVGSLIGRKQVLQGIHTTQQSVMGHAK
jgi:hypothetical protein